MAPDAAPREARWVRAEPRRAIPAGRGGAHGAPRISSGPRRPRPPARRRPAQRELQADARFHPRAARPPGLRARRLVVPEGSRPDAPGRRVGTCAGGHPRRAGRGRSSAVHAPALRRRPDLSRAGPQAPGPRRLRRRHARRAKRWPRSASSRLRIRGGSLPDPRSPTLSCRAPTRCRASSTSVSHPRCCRDGSRRTCATRRRRRCGRTPPRSAGRPTRRLSFTATSAGATSSSGRRAGRWAVAAVLDWEFAVSGSPLADVGHFLRYERKGTAGGRAAFPGRLSGGGRPVAARVAPPRATRRSRRGLRGADAPTGFPTRPPPSWWS